MVQDDQTPAEARTRAAQISNVSYALDVAVSADPTRSTFSETAVIRFDSVAASSWLDFTPGSIGQMTLNGRPIDPAAVRDGRIQLDGLQASNELRIVSEVPYQTNGIGMHRQVDPKDGQVYLYTNCEPFNAHKWFPCFDQPDIKATLELSVSAPADWHVIGNNPALGAPTISTDGTAKRVTFAQTPLISTYLMAMCAGPFAKVEHTTAGGIECAVYVRQSLKDNLDTKFFFDITERGLDFYEKLFNRPYPFAKYDQILVPEFNSGAMENPGCITFRDSVCVFFGKPTEADYAQVAEFILHEMAHMWFGDLVTLRGWEDLWLNESFADLMEKLSQDAILPDTHVWADFANGRKAWGLAADQLPSSHPVALDPVPVSRTRDNFDGITYAKGGAALAQLIAHVGKDEFFSGVREYFKAHAWGNASLADLLGPIETASGRDLSEWSQLWLRTKGMALLRNDATVGADGRYTQFDIVQEVGSGDAVLRPHTLYVGCYAYNAAGRLERTQRIPVDIKAGESRVSVPRLLGAAAPDLLIVNDDDLTYAKVRLDARSTTTMLTGLGTIEDPLARAVCWGIAWDMTRDGDLAATDFVNAVVANTGTEAEIPVLSSLLTKAASAVSLFAAPAQRVAARDTLVDAARTQMFQAPAGSDRQLLWARTYIASSERPADLAFLRRVLDGRASVPGLTVDTNLRWNLVQALASHGLVNERGIAAEEAKDGTDVGRRKALTARALRPTAAAKADAWRRVTTDRTLSLQDRNAIAAGFMVPGQERVLAPYVNRYAALVPTLWSSASPEEARALTTALYPLPLVAVPTLAAVDRLLGTNLPEPAKRALRDAQDGTRRALQAQARGVLQPPSGSTGLAAA